MRVEIWSDIACPFCYIGKARFEKGLAAFAHRDEVEVLYRSFELNPNAGDPPGAPVTQLLVEKYGLSPEKAEEADRDVAASAAQEGLAYGEGRRISGSTFDLHRLLHAAGTHGPETHDALLDAFFHAYFADLLNLNDQETLLRVATGAGLDETEVRAVLADKTAHAEAVRTDEGEAARLGATGVPFFVIDRRFGVSGAQPAEVFTQALDQAHAAGGGLVTVAAAAKGSDAPVCEDDACEVPDSRA